MQQTLEKIGKQVFYKRLQQKMTQEELCQGICSVSYLSKIENGKIEASEEILQLLCARLEIAVSDLRDVEEEVKEKLDDWLNALVHLDKQQVERIYKELQSEMKNVLDFEIINYYNLLYTRYLIMKRDLSALEEELEKLKKMYKKYSPFQKLLYTYSRALLYCMQYKYKQALEHLLKTESMAKEQGYYETGIYYNLALTYSQMEIDHMTLYFANVALEGFRNEYKFRHVINCQLLIAFSYIRKKQYSEAMGIYNHILREADSFADKDNIMSIALNNMGYLYYRQNNYEKAKEYYLEGLQYKKEEDLNYIDAMYEISLQCIQLKEFEEARGWIEKGISAARKDDRYKSMLHLLLILQYKYYGKKEVYKKFLEIEAVPFFKGEKNMKDLKKVYLELAEYFEESSEFQESNRYYKLAIMLLEEEGGVIV
ncbi:MULTISPECIES: helix-turn-helix domain-containing protein [Bacillus]|uniref:helix-turn-helix domain-containing protein n=1 Tax=Bacillus TaxID=1386 RepID=UPI0001A155C4|nr:MULTISPECIES: helix-turn-helix transcriptional regulator [Bacillus]AIK40466.1 helix-turn-helix family protein [Bacillus pseudomycoides]AJI16873.1 helix-turn-helix family protein [Bacillus pseudomycoides]EEM18473.1 Helix-turn-helix domain protein [Bacillus pseudomycoides DSM 12442]MEB3055604.1 helix-turn-helix domain-containing protein [Bacillus pseudomycoides]MED1597847.1 helix-turn-helix domain-containing protein [Bacillus pseudomycoides]